MLCMLATPWVTHPGLAGKERLKAFTLQIFKNGNGWYPGIPCATRRMLLLAEDTGHYTKQLFLG
ncbi:hypothetical protein HMPREF9540_03014 [Escherichia coli MS 115-1]|uniref:Uncharacterized protein n=1 Tax=Cedecea davisae DSM 4568 TaxID=566551 RepID=S3J185_9ENTR|nr:hypothetical protein HMPREF9540_03014 [Escherichia coli MS 115-1]EPF13657.1 hypothetical protein HMPREF0201_03847 [Cedecea davisae DSM 4568]